MSFSAGYIAGTEQTACPVFDIKVCAERRNPFSRMSLNETAKELFEMGVFSPDKAKEGLVMLELMEFEGKDAAVDKLRQLVRQSSDKE
ncbi:MAG: hypothetical protein J6Q16_03955 [Clostridia bacterium]|nr:hypothetical protein [Clostridia bacterium]